jgi:hypothetical protein
LFCDFKGNRRRLKNSVFFLLLGSEASGNQTKRIKTENASRKKMLIFILFAK